MKTKITLSALLFLICTFTGFSQSINFEDGTIPAGGWYPSGVSAAVGANPTTDGINTSTKSLNVTVNSGVAWNNSWFKLVLPSVTTITASNRYLHIMYRTDNVSISQITTVNIGATWDLGNAAKGVRRFDFTVSNANVWQELVCDLINNASVTYIGLAPNIMWSSTNTVVHINFDEIVLNDNPNPRTSITTSIKDVHSEINVTGSEQGVIVVGAKQNSEISIYNLQGMKLSTTMAVADKTFIPTNLKFLIVKVGNKAFKVVR